MRLYNQEAVTTCSFISTSGADCTNRRLTTPLPSFVWKINLTPCKSWLAQIAGLEGSQSNIKEDTHDE